MQTLCSNKYYFTHWEIIVLFSRRLILHWFISSPGECDNHKHRSCFQGAFDFSRWAVWNRWPNTMKLQKASDRCMFENDGINGLRTLHLGTCFRSDIEWYLVGGHRRGFVNYSWNDTVWYACVREFCVLPGGHGRKKKPRQVYLFLFFAQVHSNIDESDRDKETKSSVMIFCSFGSCLYLWPQITIRRNTLQGIHICSHFFINIILPLTDHYNVCNVCLTSNISKHITLAFFGCFLLRS